MRKVSKIVLNSFKNGQAKSLQNTSTNGKSVFLHGNEIIKKINDNTFEFSSCGWNTLTTKERLNAFFNVFETNFGIYQKKGVWYWSNGKEFIDGQKLTFCDNIVIFS